MANYGTYPSDVGMLPTVYNLNPVAHISPDTQEKFYVCK